MKIIFLVYAAVLFTCNIIAQTKVENDIEPAIVNAKKGIYWALTNLPNKKTRTENDLIASDKLYSKVKIEKGIGGVKIESTGFSENISVSITIYKSYDNLKKEGYIKKIDDSDFE